MQHQIKKIEVLVADKSNYTRLVLEDILSSEPDIQVSAHASDGDQLISILLKQKSDVVIVDYDLPLNNQNLTLKRIFSEAPTPVILLIPKELITLALVAEVNELGVYAIIAKPGHGDYTNYRSVAAEVISKVRAVKGTLIWDVQNRLEMQQLVMQTSKPVLPKRYKIAETVFVIGASTGGTKAIESIVSNLAPDLNATILIAVHLPQSFTRTFAKRLQEITAWRVKEGRSGLMLKPSKIIVAPGNRNMIVHAVMGDPNNIRIGFSDELTGFDQPNIDLLMQSVAASKVKNVVGILLTGMGKDGALGAARIRERGGYIVAQNEETSAIFGIAKAAIDTGVTNEVLPLAEIPHFINNYKAQHLSVSEADEKV
ncbi:chemotaxis protein CheB [Pontibacter arcticus]|uniref:protein-glutamate methylesterase n=1 Tax=Pontibacter arcticus TaxID=2080288 RepID=A0A364RG11_9BACT|nr:chemotaxis protein CheB [Pontibacter arcticus]RAU83106.1 chemotaxis response regulator protein-glutamate methylesterase [Pontibacter arcticus]